MSKRKNFKDKGTQTTQNTTDEILKKIHAEIDQLNFRLLKHPRRKELLKKQKEEEDSRKDNLDIDSILGDIRINQRDYKVLATEEIVDKANDLGFPLIYNKETVRIYTANTGIAIVQKPSLSSLNGVTCRQVCL